jgi:ferrochelatase
MLNMGGPATVPEVGPFLQRLFSDPEIIALGPLQGTLGPFIAKRRTPRIEKQYEEIGGSPIRRWTEIQGRGVTERLDKALPALAPFKSYIAFRYAHPLTEETLLEMKRDGVQRAIAFSQYPQYSCTTAGSSMNHLWRELRRLGMEQDFQWSVIDRWPVHPGYVSAIVKLVQEGLDRFPADVRSQVPIVFSSHGLPQKIIERGDQYAQEVAGTVQAVMQKLEYSNPYIHAWQSKVGPLPWLVPKTEKVLEGLGKQGFKNVLVAPVGFTSDHVETLFELDIEYKESAMKAGIERFERAASLNDEPLFIDALADVVKTHIESGQVSTNQYRINCAYCVNRTCRSVVNPIKPYSNLRTEFGFK